MNKKGFTLVELLVMLVVLSILIGIAVPNIAGIIKDNKNSMTLDDANRMLDAARVKTTIEENILDLRYDGECSLIRLSYLDKNDNFKKGPNDGTYDMNESFVIIQLRVNMDIDGKKEYNYEYFVRLIEKKGSKIYGINMATASEVEKREKSIFKRQPELFYINPEEKLTGYENDVMNIREKINNSSSAITCNDFKKDLK